MFDDVNLAAPGAYESYKAYGQSKTANIWPTMSTASLAPAACTRWPFTPAPFDPACIYTRIRPCLESGAAMLSS